MQLDWWTSGNGCSGRTSQNMRGNTLIFVFRVFRISGFSRFYRSFPTFGPPCQKNLMLRDVQNLRSEGFSLAFVSSREERTTTPKSKTLKWVSRSTNNNGARHIPYPHERRTTKMAIKPKWGLRGDTDKQRFGN